MTFDPGIARKGSGSARRPGEGSGPLVLETLVFPDDLLRMVAEVLGSDT